ncbi:hypothetical protein [Porphyromonas sp.]
MIDKTAFANEVKRIGAEYIRSGVEIDLEAINRFVLVLFNRAKDHLDKYIIAQGEKYRKELSEEQYEAFVDFETGYRAQMDRWIGEHPLKMRQRPIQAFPEPKLWQQQRVRRPLKTVAIGVGSILLLSPFTSAWVHYAVGLITAGMAVRAYRKGSREDREFYLRQQANQRTQLITQTQLDLVRWLDEAERASDAFITDLTKSL